MLRLLCRTPIIPHPAAAAIHSALATHTWDHATPLPCAGARAAGARQAGHGSARLCQWPQGPQPGVAAAAGSGGRGGMKHCLVATACNELASGVPYLFTNNGRSLNQ